MIGVAFALRDTFGRSDQIAETALANVLRAYLRTRGTTDDISEVYRTTLVRTPIASVAALRGIVATVLGDDYEPADDRKLEAHFRMEAARLVARRFVPDGDVAATLADLRRLNVPLAALGDDWAPVDQRKADAVGFSGPIVHAADVADDPSARTAFEELAWLLHLPAENVWFVGTDLKRDIAPATAAGMRAIWFDRSGSGVPPAGVRPDAIVGTFGEIRDVLGEPYTRGLLALRYIMRTSLDWRPGFSIAAGDAMSVDEAPHAPDEK